DPRRHVRVLAKQSGGLEHEVFEIEHPAFRQLPAIKSETASVVGIQRITHQSMETEEAEQRSASSGLDPTPAENLLLVFLVGDPEATLDPENGTELAEEGDRERVNGGAGHALGPVAELFLEPVPDLLRGLVGEGYRADPGGIEGAPLDQEPNP